CASAPSRNRGLYGFNSW
nr:immunoglobulin heavy chain junction region [Macaca mulatta]MOX04940.1 immunoglobulin heavy chain junction region [Macaca mulatta]